MENRWIAYTEDGMEICDCETRFDAIRDMEKRGKKFAGTYTLTENAYSEDEDGTGHLTQIGSENFTF